ncbi:MAG: mannonate dehydratase [Bacteroidia bacterium]|nr:mannonate dehydratase [Bacteroidia bacterium]
MLQTMRWFGPQDPVSLSDIRQAGCDGVVTALHHVPNGEVWTRQDIEARCHEVEWDPQRSRSRGLHWAVVESLPVHESIRRGTSGRDRYIRAWIESLRSLAACGVRTVTYNFMPALDWTRTDLAWELPDGARALRFDQVQLAAFDLFMLERPGAADTYSSEVRAAAKAWFESIGEAEAYQLQQTLLAGLPGTEEHWGLEEFRAAIEAYAGIDAARMREHLAYFLRQAAPAAQELGVRLAIHPDDPPFPILGLPRVVSTEADAQALLAAADLPANGLCFCTGSYGARPDNDLPGMVRRMAHRIHFLHLRSTIREPDGSFYEAAHLAGDVDMYAVVEAVVAEELRRSREGRDDAAIPMRPDHGHQMLDDLHKHTNPGYTAIGRLRGLAELRGLELAIRRQAQR